MKDDNVSRNQWPIGKIEETFPSEDGRIRKISVSVMKNGIAHKCTRPITQVVYLLSS